MRRFYGRGGRDLNQKGRRKWGEEVGQLNLCVKNIYPFCGGGGGNVAGGERRGGFWLHRCRGLLYAWC